jgi:murein endopeptidase
MGWRINEVWLDGEVLWFREQPRGSFPAFALAEPAFAGPGFDGALSLPVATGLEASRRRRLEAQAARRRRLATRTIPAVALVLGSSTMLPISLLRQNGGDGQARPLAEDPPSLTFRFDDLGLRALEAPVPRQAATSRQPTVRNLARATELGRVEWGTATSTGLQYAGRLSGGTQLPVEGPDWVTWNPNTDSVPNLPDRLYGHERTIRAVISVIADYRTSHPDAPPVVVGDISFPDGGRMDGHVSHQNGLDVDVYYPRLDRHLSAPISSGQVDRVLAQELLDRFVAAGAKVVFVGYATGLRGPSGVVVPYPNHEDHMHVRFPLPPG